jgi:hypothetical protein
MNKTTLSVVAVMVVSLWLVLFQSEEKAPPEQLEAAIDFADTATNGIDHTTNQPLQSAVVQQTPKVQRQVIAASSKPITPPKITEPMVNEENSSDLIEQELQPQNLEDVKSKLRMQAQQQEWGEYANTLSRWEQLSESKLAWGLMDAIKFNAPIWLFEDLLFQGAQFNFEHLREVIRGGQLELIKSLQPLGLDIHMENNQGANAVHAAAQHFINIHMMHYLLTHGVVATTKVNGEDPLALSLKRLLQLEHQDQRRGNDFLAHYNTKRYSEWFIKESGVKVEQQHIELAQQIKGVNQQTYEYLVGLSSDLKVE